MHTIQELQALANSAHKSGLIPGRLNPDQMLMIMMTGQEIGLTPMMALQKINILHDRMCLSAEAMAAVIIGAGHQIITKERSDEQCVLVGIRKGETVEHEHRFTKQDAVKAGLSGQQYQKRPATMFYNRCLTQLARAVFPDCIAGLSYGPDEIEEMAANTTKQTKRKPSKPRTPVMEGVEEWVLEAKAVMERIYTASAAFGEKADQAIYSQYGATLEHLGSRVDRDTILATITGWAETAEARANAQHPDEPGPAPEPEMLPLGDEQKRGHRDPA